MEIRVVESDEEKKAVSRKILEALTDWFAVEENREAYIMKSPGKKFIAAYEGDSAVGFLYLSQTGRETVEIAVMGVLQEFHRHGVGKKLVEKAKEVAKDAGYSFMQVKTVKLGMYEDYDRTNYFYQSLGFKEFEMMPLLWDEANPCQIYVRAL